VTESPVDQMDQPKPNEGGPGWVEFLEPMKSTAVGANVVLAALSAGLAVWADGIGRWLLGVLVAASVLLLLGQVGVVWLRLRRRSHDQLVQIRHQEELAAVRAELARTTERAATAMAELSRLQAVRGRYAAALAALHDMWLGYPAPYTDDLELTYLVGLEAGGDRVIEHRRTTPYRGAALPCLESRLTTPTQLDAEAVALADVEMVARSEDDRIAIRQIALTEKPNLLRCLFVFRPSITEPTSWYVRYRMRGMWDVLRASGHDTLTWTPAPRVGDGSRSTLSRLVVNFDFAPEAADDVFVRDRDNRELKRVTGPDGSLRYRWEADPPQPERYTWDLWWARSPDR
jgi:hypothetical protein